MLFIPKVLFKMGWMLDQTSCAYKHYEKPLSWEFITDKVGDLVYSTKWKLLNFAVVTRFSLTILFQNINEPFYAFLQT